MATRPVSPLLLSAALACSALAIGPACAQDDPAARLDALSDATVQVEPGTALARQQIAAGDLTGATSTLERVLMAQPAAVRVLLLHASLLCRLDDPQGARAEIAELRGHPIPDDAWHEVTSACGAVARPGMGR